MKAIIVYSFLKNTAASSLRFLKEEDKDEIKRGVTTIFSRQKALLRCNNEVHASSYMRELGSNDSKKQILLGRSYRYFIYIITEVAENRKVALFLSRVIFALGLPKYIGGGGDC